MLSAAHQSDMKATALHKNQAGQATKNGGEFAAKNLPEADIQLTAMTGFVSYECGHTRVEFEHIGEGRNGEYNPSAPSDAPLLRVTVRRRRSGPDNWTDIEGASWCTQLPVGINPDLLHRIARDSAVMLDGIHDPDEFEMAARQATEGIESLSPNEARTFFA